MNRKTYEETQVMGREQGALASAAISALCLFGLAVAVGLAWLTDDILRGNTIQADRVSLWIRMTIFVSALPFAWLALGKLRYMAGRIELDLYRVTGWRVDLDGDGETGESESQQQQPVTQLPEREVLRVVPVHSGASPDPAIRLPDGREIDARKVRDFVIGAGTIGMGLTAWKTRGWTRQEWETARDLLALHNLATARADGQAGRLIASPGQCMRAFGL
jgi:hypothetical protein